MQLPLCSQRLDDGREQSAIFGRNLGDVLRSPDVGLLHGLGQGCVASTVAEGAREMATLPRRHGYLSQGVRVI